MEKEAENVDEGMVKDRSDLSHGTVPKRTWNVLASHLLLKRKTQSW